MKQRIKAEIPGLATINLDELVAQAAAAREHAYAPYSRFAVGAALLGESGRVYSACNVENAVYGLSMCAERNAVFQAAAAGERKVLALAVVTESGATPCGACRQVLREFAVGDASTLMVIVADTSGNRREYTLRELLPDSFSAAELPE
jgi:cytidine deaminase